MYNILITELSPAKGHADLFQLAAQILSKNDKISVDVVSTSDSTISVSGCLCHKMPFKYPKDPWSKNRWMNLFLSILYEIRLAFFIGKESKRKKYSALFVITYNELTFPLGRLFFSHFPNIFILHNNNIDNMMLSPHRARLFNFFSNKVIHVVLADFIKDYFAKSFCINRDKILTLPTPFSLSDTPKEAVLNKDIDCLGISNGNDDSFIERLIIDERTHSTIKKADLHIVLKSNKFHFDNGFLTIINGFLPRDQFDNYVSRAKVMLIPFPLSYKYRMSGTLVDALSHDIPVLVTPIVMTEYVILAYPNQVHKLNENTFIKDVVDLSTCSDKADEGFRKFKTIHSVDYLSNTFAEDFVKVLEGETVDEREYDY